MLHVYTAWGLLNEMIRSSGKKDIQTLLNFLKKNLFYKIFSLKKFKIT